MEVHYENQRALAHRKHHLFLRNFSPEARRGYFPNVEVVQGIAELSLISSASPMGPEEAPPSAPKKSPCVSRNSTTSRPCPFDLRLLHPGGHSPSTGLFPGKGHRNILALRGDIPQDSDFPIGAHYQHAYELIQDIKSQGDFCIGGACYPEGHVECESREEDIDHLKQKMECGCDFFTTQMFFDNNMLYNFLYRTLAKGIEVPIIAGIMPVNQRPPGQALL